jgi:hypothetical protein
MFPATLIVSRNLQSTMYLWTCEAVSESRVPVYHRQIWMMSAVSNWDQQ